MCGSALDFAPGSLLDPPDRDEAHELNATTDLEFPVETARIAVTDDFPSGAPIRLLVFADHYGASQSIAFIQGLGRARRQGQAAVRILEEDLFGPDIGLRDSVRIRATVAAQLQEVQPTAIVLSRFGHSTAYEAIVAAADASGTPVIFHIDDDLFDLPATVGLDRYRRARHPRRAHTLHRALIESDFVMSATDALAGQLTRLAGHGRIGWLENGAAGRPWPRRPPKSASETVVIGYMGSASHGADLESVAPALNRLLARKRNVRIELFGSIARQPAADVLPSSITRRDAVAGDYAAFKARLGGLGWDIGLAPLLTTPYNRCKTATKWAEYAEAGVAVIASDIEPYQPMIAAEAAFPATGGQWDFALDRLIANPCLREGLVRSADALLGSSYGWDRLERSVLGLLQRAVVNKSP